MTIANLGVTRAVQSRLAKPIPVTRAAPPAPLTGSGTPAIYHPPTRQAPPNSAHLVLNQLESSIQVQTNTKTGLGIGGGSVSTYFSEKLKTPGAYLALAALGAVLVLAYAWDKGKL